MEETTEPYAKEVGAPVKGKSVIKRCREQKLGLPGSFWIPRESVETLLMSRATAVQIGVYLVIAKQTDRAGRISTSGVKTLRNRLCIGDKQIHTALDWLTRIQVPGLNMVPPNNSLLYTVQDWNYLVDNDTEIYGPEKQGFSSLTRAAEQKGKRIRNSWVVNNVGTNSFNGVWFNSALVGKNNEAVRLLADIIDLYNADSIMRLLLLLHHHYDVDMGGVDPAYVRYEYKPLGEPLSVGKFALQKFKFDVRIAEPTRFAKNVHTYVLGRDDDYDNAAVMSFLSDAFTTLDRLGLISRLVAVWNKPQVGGDSRPLYLLDQKSDFRDLPRDKETMLADHIEKVAVKYNMSASKGNHGFYDTYTVITPVGVIPTVVQMYKPTYVVEYPDNKRVRLAQQQREHNAAKVKGHLLELSNHIDKL